MCACTIRGWLAAVSSADAGNVTAACRLPGRLLAICQLTAGACLLADDVQRDEMLMKARPFLLPFLPSRLLCLPARKEDVELVKRVLFFPPVLASCVRVAGPSSCSSSRSHDVGRNRPAWPHARASIVLVIP